MQQLELRQFGSPIQLNLWHQMENIKYGVSFQLRIFFCSTYDKAKANVVHVETWLGKEK